MRDAAKGMDGLADLGTLNLQMLGSFAARADSPPRAEFVRGWADRHAGSSGVYGLFALLAVDRGRWLSRTTILDLLWPDSDHAAGSSNFYAALRLLRNRIKDLMNSGTEPIESDHGCYRLSTTMRVSVDIDAFRNFTRAAHELGNADSVAAARASLELYSPLLQDAKTALWIEPLRVELEEQAILNSLLVARAEIAGRSFGAAEETLWRAVLWRRDDSRLTDLIDVLYSQWGRTIARHRARRLLAESVGEKV